MEPFPHQVTAARFLAKAGTSALLGDEPRVGKTGAAIIAADDLGSKTILVITTASGRAVWLKAFRDWSKGRRVAIWTGGAVPDADVIIISWSNLSRQASLAPLMHRTWDLIVSDEDHAAKSFTSKRTQSLYGRLVRDGRSLDQARALCVRGARLWCLTGTPLPHSPFDAYPRMRALTPEKLLANPKKGWPDVTTETSFKYRYCIVARKRISPWSEIDVVVGGKNEHELRDRIGNWMLRRTQAEVGIREPIYETMPVMVSAATRRNIERNLPAAAILAAADKGDTRSLDMHLGPLRRLTGTIKAPAIVEAARDEFDTGLDRLVIAYWHKDVGEILLDGLADYGVTGIDGSTPLARRSANLELFAEGKRRVFLQQIEAAGEAVDLSASCTLWFAETTFVPRQMKQASLRITNINQRRQCFVKVCTLAESIDEAVQERLLRLWTAIRSVLNVHNGD